MSILRRFFQYEGLYAVALRQQQTIGRLLDEQQKNQLEYARTTRNLVEHFLVALEHPEFDYRSDILKGLRDLEDEIARLEEHVT